jgi:transposase
MCAAHFIALDTHCSFTEMAVVNGSGKLTARTRCDTTIPAIVEAIDSVRRPRSLTFEEGPLAGWLARNLRQHVDRLIVCEPRRNHWIAKEGDKDDDIDAEKLAQLLRGGYLKEVHQNHTLERAILKQHVAFYHDRVRERVRQGHQAVALLRRQGVFTRISHLHDDEDRRHLLKKLPRSKLLLADFGLLWNAYELLLSQEEELREELIRLARKESQVRRFTQVPGIAWIRGLTFFVYIDTPERFLSKSALWRYCGIGLERKHSGRGPTKIRVAKGANHRLKDVLVGAARTAITAGDNPFADKYHYWTQEQGEHPSTARRNVARCLAVVLWSMWKTGSAYDPALVRGVGRPSLS